ncbi:MAG: hypothetical protein JSR17_07210 [Proteobacteria bacterium]|nr:hypothetical protein [Pseudomonadota bacterium]
MSFSSVVNIYANAFKLLTKSFLSVLPFSLLYIMIEYLINKYIPFTLTETGEPLSSFANPLLSLLIMLLCFNCILYGIYQKHHQLKFNYVHVILNGLYRFFPALTALFLILLPIIVISIALNYISGIFETLSITDSSKLHFMAIVMIGILFLFFIGMITWLIMSLYFYTTPVIVVIKKETAINGLKHSWQLLHGHWFRTFLIVFMLIVASTLLQMGLFLLIGNLSAQLIELIMLPLVACVMILYHEQLEKEN